MALDPTINFGKVTVAGLHTASDTSITLDSGEGAKLPDPAVSGPFDLVWWQNTDNDDPITDTAQREMVRCTANVADVLTVTRAQQGTSASIKNTSGKSYSMWLGPTQKTMDDIEEQIATGERGVVTDTGAADVYAGTLDIGQGTLSALVIGMRVRFNAVNANTGSSTFNLQALGAVTIVKSGDIALISGDIPAGGWVELVYDGTNWVLISSGGLNNTPVGTLQAIGEAWLTAAAASTISTVNIWVKVGGTTSLRTSTNVDDSGGTSNRLRYTASNRARFSGEATISYSSASSNQVMGAIFAKQASMGTSPLTTVGAGLSTIDLNWPNHGAILQDWVNLVGVTGPIDGITAAQLNTQHTITSLPDANTIRITVASDTATAGGVAGGGSGTIGRILLRSSMSRRKTGTGGDVGAAPVQCIALLNQNEALEIWVRNTTGTSNFTVDTLNMRSSGFKL